MRLVRRANKRLSLLTLDDVQEESEQQAYIAVAILLQQSKEQLLVLINLIPTLLYINDILSNIIYDSGQFVLFLIGV